MSGKLIGFIEGSHLFRCSVAKNAGRNRKQIRLLFGTTRIPIVCQKHRLRSDAHSIAVDHRQYERSNYPNFFLHGTKVISILRIKMKKMQNGSLNPGDWF